MLVLITVVALVPLGVGLGISQLLGKGPTTTDQPPVATVTSARGSVRVRPAPFEWAVGGARHAVADRASGPQVTASEAVLEVAPGGSLTLAWSTTAAPSSVTLALASPGAPAQLLTPGNPIRVTLRKPAGTYAIVVASTWAQGQASYYFRLDVT